MPLSCRCQGRNHQLAIKAYKTEPPLEWLPHLEEPPFSCSLVCLPGCTAGVYWMSKHPSAGDDEIIYFLNAFQHTHPNFFADQTQMGFLMLFESKRAIIQRSWPECKHMSRWYVFLSRHLLHCYHLRWHRTLPWQEQWKAGSKLMIVDRKVLNKQLKAGSKRWMQSSRQTMQIPCSSWGPSKWQH